MMSVCVDPDLIETFWPYYRDWVKRAIDKVGLADLKLLEQNLMEGKSLLWLAYDGREVHAVATTDLYADHCTISACSGQHLKHFLPLIKDLERYARKEGKKSIRVEGRRGWERVLKDYRRRAVVLEKVLE